jgi:SAM-dependent methyltransferase
MLEAAELRGHERVLDLGTGAGHTAVAFAPRVVEVVALDLTAPMLEQARALAAAHDLVNLRFELGDAMALPYEAGCFDLVTCRVCAHHFADPRAALREAARVMRPGGRLLLADSVSPEDPAQDTFLNCVELLRDPSHVRDYSVSQWCSILAEAGLEPEPIASWGVPRRPRLREPSYGRCSSTPRIPFAWPSRCARREATASRSRSRFCGEG